MGNRLLPKDLWFAAIHMKRPLLLKGAFRFLPQELHLQQKSPRLSSGTDFHTDLPLSPLLLLHAGKVGNNPAVLLTPFGCLVASNWFG